MAAALRGYFSGTLVELGGRRFADSVRVDPKDKFWKVAAVAVMTAVVLVAVIIMARGAGLVPELDFGAGAYYYADIPGFEKIVRDDAYTSRLPLWLAIILFLAWGAFVYWLWTRIDRK